MNKVRGSLIFLTLIVAAFSYQTSLAHDLTHLEAITYESQANIDSWNCQQCSRYQVKNQKSFFSSSANIQGYGAYYVKENAIIIAFRGSVDVKNWLFNLNTAIVGYPACSGCNVHMGFYNAYKGVAPLVRTLVDQLRSLHRDAKLIITGHSLGGAMAVLCALDLKEIHGKVDFLYTFGQPRVGNQKFANFLESQIPQTFRIINFADTVPHVPPSAFTFKHGGNEMWYNPRGMTGYKQCVSEDKTCANSISTTAMSTDDHSLSIYMTLKVNPTGKHLKTQEETLAQNYTQQEIEEAQVKKVFQILQLIGQQIKAKEATY